MMMLRPETFLTMKAKLATTSWRFGKIPERYGRLAMLQGNYQAIYNWGVNTLVEKE